MSLRRAWRIGAIGGITIAIHPSWFVIYAVFSASAATAVGLLDDTLSRPDQIAVGLIVSVIFFASVVAHELGHALVARRLGIPTGPITLFLFGGVATILSEPGSPGAELRMAAAGPLVSLLLGGAFLGLYASSAYVHWVAGSLGAELLGGANFMLAVFNLLPAFPSDGGRVLRAFVWRCTGSRAKATAIASTVSLAVAALLMIFGAYVSLVLHMLRGLWTAAIAVFLAQAALASSRQARTALALEGMRVADCMQHDLTRVPADTSVAAFFAQFADRSMRGYAIMNDGSFVGLLSIKDASVVASAKQAQTPVTAVMVPAHRTPLVAASSPAGDALTAMALNRVADLPVLENGDLAGTVSQATIYAALRRDRRGSLR
ncbi:MAG: site-2 protease family protein [Candidatus Eremiobacteraeota bacterium]|nr:site-2 protease family protein [Candidatus Eremiobacteraeota bacterium]